MYWFAHTDAEIEISSDGKSAILAKNGKKIKAQDDYEFTNISDLCYEGDETEQTVTETTESKASGSCNSISLCTPAAVAFVGATAVITSKRKKENKK